MNVEKAEKKEIENFLLKNIIWSSGVISTIEDAPVQVVEWFAAKDGGSIRTAMMLCPGFSPTPIFFVGNATGLPGLLDTARHSPSVLMECPLDFVGLIKRRYSFSFHSIMARMVLRRDISSPAASGKRASRLTGDDLKKAFDLYKEVTGKASGFDSSHFLQGVYYGIKDAEGRLVSMAGTQSVSLRYGAATVGNVITRQDSRGHGYATACVISLVDELKDKFPCIVMNVNYGDKTAMNIYRKCGFAKELEYFEGEGTRKEV